MSELSLLSEWESTIYDLIRDIRDPEKPDCTLEELQVVQEDLVRVRRLQEHLLHVHVHLVPTVTHCSLATLIGLCVRTKLNNELPSSGFKIDVDVKEDKHDKAADVNKQINDKERVAAALENNALKSKVEECINYEQL